MKKPRGGLFLLLFFIIFLFFTCTRLLPLFIAPEKIFLGTAFPIVVFIFHLLFPEIFSQSYLKRTAVVNSETGIINGYLFRSH